MNSRYLMRGWNWCRRFRHRRGYGVHSPSDFFLITSVIYEELPYYAYTPLAGKRAAVATSADYREKTHRFLFRLANYLHPASILDIGTGSGLTACYLAEACRRASLLTLDTDTPARQTADPVSSYPRVSLRRGQLMELLHREYDTRPLPAFIHLGPVADYEAVFEFIVRRAASHTCVAVAAPHAGRRKKHWWKQVISDPRTGVTFDLYDVGLVFFDPKRVKEHRVVNFL